ncbi:serine/threonine-protein phosphatase 7 long form homolog [Abrus precatorius]|uniref:Serine/threonine-protein phosphatase 7 long form homolog n=1 Tax=Abrus precatorius TaxID=3816 RepID=A0A8B8KSZ9_ABRPR|nr:serine/threonine-protein phosphatase 7 long form homolog [Abrus precatorius]
MEGVPVEIISHLTLAGFAGVVQLACFPIDRHLITALVERWRLETHTFHMVPGEYTITFQDIAIQIGLRIDGKAVIAAVRGNKAQIMEDLLGIRPLDDAFMGSGLKLSWLDQHFTHVAMHNHNELQLTRFARAYILRLIGDFMLADHSSREYSGGAAALAFLYQKLCMSTNIKCSGIGGLTPLLMMWAWDRFPFLQPNNLVHTRPDIPYGARWLVSQSYSRHDTRSRHRPKIPNLVPL